MPEDSIKDFTINWIVIGLLTFSLVTFAVSFMHNNNSGGLGEAGGKFDNVSSGLETKLLQSSSDANVALNITASTNPEASQLGSRDSVSTAFEMKNTGTGIFETTKTFISWVLVGDAGEMLLSVLGGILVFLLVYFIYKFIRTGS